MILNDYKHDIEMMIRADGRARQEIAAQAGMEPSGLTNSIKRANGGYLGSAVIRIFDALGYDIKIGYVKHGDSDIWS